MNYEEYITFERDNLPYDTEWGFVITHVSVSCPNCGSLLDGPKFRFIELTSSNVVEVKSCGICHKCKLIAKGRGVRIYEDDRIMIQNDDGTWRDRIPSLWERADRWWRTIRRSKR